MSFTRFRERSRDVQDGTERHVFSEQEYLKEAGSIVKVKGTDSEDQEASVLNIGGVSFNLKKDSDTEVFLLASSSDTTLKMAVMTIPKDKQRRWEEGSGGVQHPTDAEFALDFSDKLAHLTKNKFAVGEKGEFEVKGEEMYIRSKKVIIDGELIVNKQVKTPTIAKGNEDPPKFEGSKQAELKDKGESSQTSQFELDFGP
jgi:hypothetical protein